MVETASGDAYPGLDDNNSLTTLNAAECQNWRREVQVSTKYRFWNITICPLFVDSPLADIMTISKFWPTGGLILLGLFDPSQ